MLMWTPHDYCSMLYFKISDHAGNVMTANRPFHFAMEAVFRTAISPSDRSLTYLTSSAQLNTSQAAVRRVYKMLREKIAAAVQTTPMIGGPGTVVEVDEAKFGRRKYQRGRTVNGSWVCGGVQRNSDNCFLTPCSGNKRNAGVLSAIIIILFK